MAWNYSQFKTLNLSYKGDYNFQGQLKEMALKMKIFYPTLKDLWI